MKNFNMKCSLLTLLLMSSVLLKSQTTSPALAYMEEMSFLSSELKDETWQYLKAVTKGKSARKVEKKRIELINKVGAKKREISAKRKFTEDGSYKKAVENYLQMTYTVLKEDYDKILDMEDIAEQSYDLMEAYILAKELANEKLEGAFDELKAAQEEFAAANNINLVEGEMDKKSLKIESANEALGYYNDVYLIFFKSYKQEAYIQDAFSRADVNAMEQNINTMLTFNEEGLSKLDELDNYNGDAALKLAVKKILRYFDEEAKVHYPSMVNFFVAKDNFEKATAIIESKKKSKRTQDDIDNYNTAVKTFNNEVKAYNATTQLTNNERSKLLEGWNKEVDAFFKRQTN